MSVNITVEDTSPLIQYEPPEAWIDSPQTDALLQQASQVSFRTTSQSGATASFSFTGTGVWVFGSRRLDHGRYLVRVDDGPEVVMDGSSPSPIANAPLFKASGFSSGPHTVTITNSPENDQATGFDIDYVVFETQLQAPDTIDDANSAIMYLPTSDSWQLNQRDIFADGTSHFSQAPGAAVRFAFTGDAVSLYGSISQAHAQYSVTIDGLPVAPSPFVPSVSAFHASSLLFFGNGFGPGEHTLVLTSDSSIAGGPYLDFDYAQVFKAVDLPASTSAVIPVASSVPTRDSDTQLPQTSDRHHFTSVEIAGIAAGALLGLCLLLAGLILCLKSRRQIQSSLRPGQLHYPFKGLSSINERFVRASAAEKGEASAQSPASEKTLVTSSPQSLLPQKTKLPTILTDFSPAITQPSVISTVPRVPAPTPAPARRPIPVRRAATQTAAAGAPKPTVRVLGPSTLPPSSHGPPRKHPTSDSSATSTSSAPQRPQVRPPPITFEPDVSGPARPQTRPNTLLLSPAPVPTVTFGEGD